MSDIVIINNFFRGFSFIENELKKIPLYPEKEFNKKFNQNQTWPGKRSESLLTSNKILVALFIETTQRHDFFKRKKMVIGSMHTHLRLHGKYEGQYKTGSSEDSDWIHEDTNMYSMLVYLSPTCLTSGTNFYLEKKENTLTHKVAFVQNTAVIFKGNIFHKSASNYGDSIENGRFTLNIFFDSIDE
jgi:hypothetical protein